MKKLKEKCIYFCEKSSIHGLRYLVHQNRISQVVWFVILCLSSASTCYIFLGSYDAFINRPISFATETTYLDWNTTFPAISICEVWYKNKYWDRLDHYQPKSKTTLQDFLSETIFFTGQCYSCRKLSECPDCSNFNNLTLNLQQFRTKCRDIFIKCLWNDIEFNCCEQFLPLKTEYGVCFTVNSLHTRAVVSPKISMISNQRTGPGQLKVYTTPEDIKVSIHAPEDVPFINQDPVLKEIVAMGKKLDIIFSITEISNDDGVRAVPPKQRGCLYPDERDPSLMAYDFHSYSTCIVQCRIEHHFKFCNCTHHLMPNVERLTKLLLLAQMLIILFLKSTMLYFLDQQYYCTAIQLVCLADYYETVNRIRDKETGKLGIVCECPPSCIEPEHNIIFKSLGQINENEPKITIKMQALPSNQFKRNVVRTKLDLIVSIGGDIGLFFGGSVLSLLEVIYILCIRKSNKKSKLHILKNK